MNKLFYIGQSCKHTYSDLMGDLNTLGVFKTYIWCKSTYQVFLRILHSLIYDYPIVLLDGDFTKSEINNSGILLSDLNNEICINKIEIKTFKEVLEKVRGNRSWEMTLLTSGTTGIPKKITHNFESITKAVKISQNHAEDIWGYAYNPTHMAGVQVFFQALLNQNTLINIFQLAPEIIREYIEKYHISHISATPTFYRLILKDRTIFNSIKQISSGGEKLTENLKLKVQLSFPKAKIRNIYASTEAGSLFSTEGENFKIPKRYVDKIKIVDNEILIHESLLGKSTTFKITDHWYYTSDIVEIVKKEPSIVFRFINRKNQIINVGGYKVNPEEVEEALLDIPSIKAARVYGKSNSVLGNILCADIIADKLTEKDIRQNLKLQSFKIPRIINFKDKIDLTRSGKVMR